MTGEKKIDYVLLGLLSHEDMTGYTIKKAMDTSLRFFWGASYGSIYPALADLVRRGLATRREVSQGKRVKHVYAITDKGRAYLREWLGTTAEKDELRYETLLKLFFGSECGPAQSLAHIESFREKIQKELSMLLDAEKNLKPYLEMDRSHAYYWVTLQFGIKTYRTYLAWCEEASAFLREHGE